MNNPPHASDVPKDSGTIWIIVAIIGLIVVGGIVFAAYGIIHFNAAVKEAEARNNLGQISRLAIDAYQRDGAICPSASEPVPRDERAIRGRKYPSSADDWLHDQAQKSGFSCLRFRIDSPQRYQYDYRATPTSFTATARGDLDGDGVFSEYTMTGALKDDALDVALKVEEKNPGE